jgi:P27 family predicted phage terminase small subunit
MRGRKPRPDNVIPMRPDDPADDASADRRIEATRRAVTKLRPRGLSEELKKEWSRVATILAEPTVDRLKARYVDVIIEYCRVIVRLRALRGAMKKIADETYKVEGGRYGDQMKSHPHVAQINESWRQWRTLVAMLGLSPADERNMIPGQGDLFDESDHYLA